MIRSEVIRTEVQRLHLATPVPATTAPTGTADSVQLYSTDTNTCCQVNNPPWFTKTLPSPTADDIELRMCYWGGLGHIDIPIELIEIYVQ